MFQKTMNHYLEPFTLEKIEAARHGKVSKHNQFQQMLFLYMIKTILPEENLELELTIDPA